MEVKDQSFSYLLCIHPPTINDNINLLNIVKRQWRFIVIPYLSTKYIYIESKIRICNHSISLLEMKDQAVVKMSKN